MASLSHVELGNTHAQPDPDSQFHEWSVFVRPAAGGKRTLQDIQRAVFTLHADFKPNVVTVEAAPFEVAREGWGEFEVFVDLYLSDGTMHSVSHVLSFASAVTSATVALEGATTLCQAGENETLKMIAARLGCDAALLVHKNKRRYPGLRASTKLHTGTTLLVPAAGEELPNSRKKAKRQKIEEVETVEEAGLVVPYELGSRRSSRASAQVKKPPSRPPPKPPPPPPVKPKLTLEEVRWLEGMQAAASVDGGLRTTEAETAHATVALPADCVADAAMCWAFIQRFSEFLKCSPFPFGNFEQSLILKGSCKLSARVHLRLVQTLLDNWEGYPHSTLPLNNLTWSTHVQTMLEHEVSWHQNDLLINCEMILEAVILAQDSHPNNHQFGDVFSQPIAEAAETLEGYSTVVAEPMDFSQIQARLSENRYTADGADDSHQFAYDMRLVWNNCYAYHGAEGSLSGLARDLEALFELMWGKFLELPQPEDNLAPSHSPSAAEGMLQWVSTQEYYDWSVHHQIELLCWLTDRLSQLPLIRQIVDSAMELSALTTAAPQFSGGVRLSPFAVSEEMKFWIFDDDARVFAEDVSSGAWHVCGMWTPPKMEKPNKKETKKEAAKKDTEEPPLETENAWLLSTQSNDTAQLRLQLSSIERGFKDSLGPKWLLGGARAAWRLMLEEGELQPATLATLLAALEGEAYQHLAPAEPEDRVFRSMPDPWQLHRAVWHRQVLKVATLPQLSWRASELHLALRHLMAHELKAWNRQFKMSNPVLETPDAAFGCQVPPPEESFAIFLGSEHQLAVAAAEASGNLFQEEQPGGPWAPFTDSAFECTVASSSCHVSATGHACFLVEMTIRRKIEFRQVTQQAGGLSLQVVSTPTLLDLQAEGLLQSADVSKCKKCDQPAVAGNYGFCLEHREFKGSTVAVPAVVGANTLVIKKQKQVDRASASLCTVCAVGGDLSSCDLCPAKFHARCVQRVVGQSLCPAHYCGRCGSLGGANDSGGTLKRQKKQQHRDALSAELSLVCMHCKQSFCKACASTTQLGKLQHNWWRCAQCLEPPNKFNSLVGCIVQSILAQPSCEPFVENQEEVGSGTGGGLGAVALKASQKGYTSLSQLEAEVLAAISTDGTTVDAATHPVLQLVTATLKASVEEIFKTAYAIESSIDGPSESTGTLGEAAAANQTAAEELLEEEVADVEATEAMDADAVEAVAVDTPEPMAVDAPEVEAVEAVEAEEAPEAEAEAEEAQEAEEMAEDALDTKAMDTDPPNVEAPEAVAVKAPEAVDAETMAVAQIIGVDLGTTHSVAQAVTEASDAEAAGAASQQDRVDGNTAAPDSAAQQKLSEVAGAKQHVKRPKTSYMWWLDANRDKLRELHKGVPYNEFNRLMGLQWSQMEATDRAPWTKLGNSDRDRYKIELQRCLDAGIVPFSISHEGAKRASAAALIQSDSPHAKCISKAPPKSKCAAVEFSNVEIPASVPVQDPVVICASAADPSCTKRGTLLATKGLIACECGCNTEWRPDEWATQHACNPTGVAAILIEGSQQPFAQVWGPPVKLSQSISDALVLSHKTRTSRIHFVSAGAQEGIRFTVVVHAPNQAFLSVRHQKEPTLFDRNQIAPQEQGLIQVMERRDCAASGLKVGDYCIVDALGTWRLACVHSPVRALEGKAPVADDQLLLEHDRAIDVTWCDRLAEVPRDASSGCVRFGTLPQVHTISAFGIVDAEVVKVHKTTCNQFQVSLPELKSIEERYSLRNDSKRMQRESTKQ